MLPTSGDDLILGTNGNDILPGLAGDDTIQGLRGNDTLLGGRDDDLLLGGTGADVLWGDVTRLDASGNPVYSAFGNDTLVGGKGRDILYGWGNDVLVGGDASNYTNFLPSGQTSDGQRDIFVAINRGGVDYTLTILDYEVGIDKIDLSAFDVMGASDFVEIQNKGTFFELKTPENPINDAQLVLRINASPYDLTYVDFM